MKILSRAPSISLSLSPNNPNGIKSDTNDTESEQYILLYTYNGNRVSLKMCIGCISLGERSGAALYLIECIWSFLRPLAVLGEIVIHVYMYKKREYQRDATCFRFAWYACPIAGNTSPLLYDTRNIYIYTHIIFDKITLEENNRQNGR